MFSLSRSWEATFSKSHLTNSGELRGKFIVELFGFHKNQVETCGNIRTRRCKVAKLHLLIAVKLLSFRFIRFASSCYSGKPLSPLRWGV
jgi:hypothetical protein